MNESIDYLHEVFDAFGPIRARLREGVTSPLAACRGSPAL